MSTSTAHPSRSAVQEVPVELLDLILGFVAPTDHTTLAACALVSHTWCAFARPYLFARLRISRTGDFEDLPAKLVALPDVACMIRTLELASNEATHIRTASAALRERKRNAPWLDLLGLATILARLPRLRELSLTGVVLVGPRDRIPHDDEAID